jgi:hypothetical protein
MEKFPPIKKESGTTEYSGTSGYTYPSGSTYSISIGTSTYTWTTSGILSPSGSDIPTPEKPRVVDITSRGRLPKIKPSKKDLEHFPTGSDRIKNAMRVLQNSIYGAFGYIPKKDKFPTLSSKLKPIK